MDSSLGVWKIAHKCEKMYPLKIKTYNNEKPFFTGLNGR